MVHSTAPSLPIASFVNSRGQLAGLSQLELRCCSSVMRCCCTRERGGGREGFRLGDRFRRQRPLRRLVEFRTGAARAGAAAAALLMALLHGLARASYVDSRIKG